MTAQTYWFACTCGRNFVEHDPPDVMPEGKCPDCGAAAQRRTITEAAAQISAAAEVPPAPKAANKRRA